MAVPRPASPSDRHMQRRFQELQLKSLSRIRATAEKWAGSISALTAVFNIVVLLKGREDVSELPGIAQALVGVALLVALICAFVAIYQAALAAQGSPMGVYSGAANFRETYMRETERAARQLWWSRLFVIPATLALALAIGITWFWPIPAAERRVSALAVQRSGALACGRLVAPAGGGVTLQASTADGRTVAVPDIVAASPIGKCP